MSLRDHLRKAASLIVELPPEEPSAPQPQSEATELPTSDANLDALLAELENKAAPGPTKTVEEIVRDAAGPNLDQIEVDAATTAKLSLDGSVDFAAIYRQASLPATPFDAEQFLEMLSSLPQELPLDTKRSTVKVSLNALGKTTGTTPDTIVADASRKLAALASYLDSLGKLTNEQVAKAEQEIAEFQARIEERRKAIQSAQQLLFETTQRCTVESDRLDDVLEFFSLDVPPSKYASTP